MIPTFFLEEMLATKLRALLQRDKGRDLYDLAHALGIFQALEVEPTIDIFGHYLDLAGQAITHAQAQERMFAKLANPHFLPDMRPLLPLTKAEALTKESIAEAFPHVFTVLVDKLPGEPWAKTSDMEERFGVTW